MAITMLVLNAIFFVYYVFYLQQFEDRVTIRTKNEYFSLNTDRLVLYYIYVDLNML